MSFLPNPVAWLWTEGFYSSHHRQNQPAGERHERLLCTLCCCMFSRQACLFGWLNPRRGVRDRVSELYVKTKKHNVLIREQPAARGLRGTLPDLDVSGCAGWNGEIKCKASHWWGGRLGPSISTLKGEAPRPASSEPNTQQKQERWRLNSSRQMSVRVFLVNIKFELRCDCLRHSSARRLLFLFVLCARPAVSSLPRRRCHRVWSRQLAGHLWVSSTAGGGGSVCVGWGGAWSSYPIQLTLKSREKAAGVWDGCTGRQRCCIAIKYMFENVTVVLYDVVMSSVV